MAGCGRAVFTSSEVEALGHDRPARIEVAWPDLVPLLRQPEFTATGVLTARVGTGIAVSGMLGATVPGNHVRWLHPGGVTRCPDVDTAASNSARTVDVAFDGCIGD